MLRRLLSCLFLLGALEVEAADTCASFGPRSCPVGSVSADPPTYLAGESSPMSLDALGRLRVYPEAAPSYACAFTVAAATNATDVFCVEGSASKVVRVKEIAVTATGGAAATVRAVVVRRSALDSGGTSSTPTIAKYDSSNAAATAVCRVWTVNPAGIGATAGDLRQRLLSITTPGVSFVDTYTADIEAASTQSYVLRSATHAICFSTTGSLPAATSIVGNVSWTEE